MPLASTCPFERAYSAVKCMIGQRRQVVSLSRGSANGGRAGRRGLDTQGNLVYVGSRASFTRKLMIGEVSNITGKNQNPQYPAMALQGILSPRHVGWGRCEVLRNQTLSDFVSRGNSTETGGASYTFDKSLKILENLNLISRNEADPDVWEANETYEVDKHQLVMLWELRGMTFESITLAKLFVDLLEEIRPISGLISETNREKGVMITDFLLSLFLTIVDRHRCDPDKESFQRMRIFLRMRRKSYS